MNTFKLHTLQSAPEGSTATLQAVNKNLGFIPNLYAILAESPPSAQSYFQLVKLLEQSALSQGEQEVIALVVSVENNCSYCVAVHSFLARNYKVEEATIAALRSSKACSNTKLNALASFARAVVRERGNAGEAAIKALIAAGYHNRHALEVIQIVSATTLSNYTNRLVDTPLDDVFANDAWI
jgi:uncharacterized peroxidase-related enzyme